LLSSKTVPAGLNRKAEKSAIAPQLLRAKQEQLFAEYIASLRKKVIDPWGRISN